MAEALDPRFVSARARVERVAVISMHTSPTAALGHSANGGLNVYVREVCRVLSQRGVRTDVFTRVPAGAATTVERIAPLSRVISIPAGPDHLEKYALIDAVDDFAAGILAEVNATGIEYDVIHSHYWLSGAVAERLTEDWSIPWAHTAHTLALVKNRQLAPDDIPEPRFREHTEAAVARGADLLVVSTPSEAHDLATAYACESSRLSVVAPGVDVDRFAHVPRFTARLRLGMEGLRPLLFAGRLERLKGAEVAIRAFATVAPRHPDTRLLVIGDDSNRGGESEQRRLGGIAGELGVADRVDFLGSVDHERLPLYYSAAEALLMPSYSESFGLVGLEAQACGCPVVAADVAGLASVVRDGVTGFLVQGHRPVDYAARLERLLAEPGLSEALGRSGRLLAQRFTWERTGDRLLAAYGDLVGSAAQAPAQVRVQLSASTE